MQSILKSMVLSVALSVDGIPSNYVYISCFLFLNIQWNTVGLSIDCIFLPISQSHSEAI